jgi:hypothetical protein
MTPKYRRGIGSVPHGPRALLIVVPAITVFVLIELVSQHVVFAREMASRQAAIGANDKVISELRHLDVRPPCVVTSDSTQPFSPVAMPAAYSLHCSYAWDMTSISPGNHSQIVMIEGRTGHPFSYARGWPDYRLRTSDGAQQIWAAG